MPACRYVRLVCVRLLGWTASPSTSQQTLSVADGEGAKSCHRFAYPASKNYLSIRGGQSASIPAAFRVPVSSPHGCSGLRTFPARVGTLHPFSLSHCASQTAPGTTRHRSACPLLLVDSCAVHVSTDTKKQTADQSNDQSAARCLYGFIYL